MTKNEESLGKLFGAQLVKSLIDIQATKVLRRLVPEALCHTETGELLGAFCSASRTERHTPST